MRHSAWTGPTVSPRVGGRAVHCLFHFELTLRGQSRRRDVDRLLEEWSFQRIRLVEYREGQQVAVGQDTLERHLSARKVLLCENLHIGRVPTHTKIGVVEDASDPGDGSVKLIGCIRSHDALARGQRQRLDDAGKCHAGKQCERRFVTPKRGKPGAGQPGIAKPRPSQQFVSRGSNS